MVLLCLTAFTLGIRHGLDFDHIAAMLDMAGTSAAERNSSEGRISRLLQHVKLPSLYVLGHSLMVVILGLAALFFGAVIPGWLDEFMERLVGVTLLLLSIYLFYSLGMVMFKGQELKLKSRWMVVFSGAIKLWHWTMTKLFGHTHEKQPSAAINWDAKGAFLVGMIHGFGAETGTQVLLFASVVGTGSMVMGLPMLTAFVIGMTISTLVIAISVSAGLATSAYFKPVLFVLGLFAALFSLTVGVYFTFGYSGMLPSF